MDYLEVIRACESNTRFASDHHDHIPLALEAWGGMALRVMQEPDHADDGRRVDSPCLRLVVEADVAAHDGGAEGSAGFCHPLYAPDELVVVLLSLGTAEVQAVGERDRLRPDAREVAVRLGDRGRAATLRVEVAVAAPPVGRKGEAELRSEEHTSELQSRQYIV